MIAFRSDSRIILVTAFLSLVTPNWGLERASGLLIAQTVSNKRMISTKDGLAIGFGKDGRVDSIAIDDSELPKSLPFIERAGWQVVDVKNGGSALIRGGKWTQDREKAIHTVSVPELRLLLEIKYTPKDAYVLIEGAVTDRSGNERALDISFRLPVPATGWLWETDINDRVPIVDLHSKLKIYRYRLSRGLGPINSTRLSGDVAGFPFAGISNVAGNTGITLAIPPDTPLAFDGGYESGLLYLTVKVGTSPAYKTPNVTPFRMMLFRHDPRWGFRDMLRRYYHSFPRYFTNRLAKHGLGTTYVAEDPIPSDIAFHLIDEPASQARNIEEYIKQGNVPFAREHGILSFPYSIWGQRQVFLKDTTLIQDPDEAWKRMLSWKPDVPMYYATTLPALNYKSPEEHKEIIQSSVVHGPDRRPVFVPRIYWHKNALTFVMNPDPDLFHDRDIMTVAKFHLNYFNHLLEGIPDLAGFFHDSQYGWGLYFNFRREHFQYADVALSYHPVSKEVCLFNKFSLNESLTALKKMYPDKLLFGNGSRPNFVFNVFPVDIAAVELLNVSKLWNPHRHCWYRMAAGPKPVLTWSYREWDQRDRIEEFWQRCLLYGYALSARGVLARPVDFDIGQGRVGPELENELRRKYVPALRAISEAGWQPVTHAWCDRNEEVRMERFGPGPEGRLYLTIFNYGERDTEVAVTVDRKALGLASLKKAVNLVPKFESYMATDKADGLSTLEVSIPKLKTVVLQFQSSK